MSNPFSEKRSVVRMAEGSYEGFRELYDHFSPLLYGFALQLSGSHDSASELVQETFVKVWISRRKIYPAHSFKAYLFRIARNAFIDMLRREFRTTGLDAYGADVYLSSGEEGGEGLDRQYLNERMEAAKKKLSPRQREIFELNKIEGKSVSEISSMLGIGEQTIYNQLSSAMRILRRELGGGPLLPLLLIFLSSYNT